MRQVGDVLNNLGSFLSSGLDSLSISLSGANANPGAMGTGGGSGGSSGVGPSPPPPHTPQSPHPLSSPTFVAASLASPSLAPSPNPSFSLLAGPQSRAPATEGNGGLSHPHRPGMEDPAAAVPMLSGEQRLASLPNFLLQVQRGGHFCFTICRPHYR